MGGGAGWMTTDKEKEEREYWEAMARNEAERKRKMLEMYDKTYDDPWQGWNTGGAINARPGYYNGGGAWSDVAGDEEVPGSYEDKIMSITGQGGIEGQGGLEDIMETFDVSSGPGQGDMSGWYEMYEDLKGKGELPDWMDSFEMFMQNLDVLDISPTDFSAQGGYKTRPKKFVGGLLALLGAGLAGKMLGGRKKSKFSDVKSKNPLSKIHKPFMPVLDELDEDEEFPILHELAAQGGYKKRPQYAGGGIEDLDMTGGGASFGPGTGTSDDIPAMLSDGEFVVTANAVQNLGGGDRMLGAQRMYRMMNQLDPNSQTPGEMSTVGYA